MPDETRNNLEPIEERDLDLEGKFESKIEKEGEPHAVEKEAPKEVSAVEKDEAYKQALSKVQAISDEDEVEIKEDAEVIVEKEQDAEGKIQNLVDLALNKGVKHAVNVARHLDDNYVLDSLHDKLISEELHEALATKGLIKEG